MSKLYIANLFPSDLYEVLYIDFAINWYIGYYRILPLAFGNIIYLRLYVTARTRYY